MELWELDVDVVEFRPVNLLRATVLGGFILLAILCLIPPYGLVVLSLKREHFRISLYGILVTLLFYILAGHDLKDKKFWTSKVPLTSKLSVMAMVFDSSYVARPVSHETFAIALLGSAVLGFGIGLGSRLLREP